MTSIGSDRLKNYKDYLDFYNGVHWQAPKRRERQLTFNYAKTFIDKITSYMMSSLTFAVDPLVEDDEHKKLARQIEKVLAHIYEDNSLAALDFETEIDTAILGDGAFKVFWNGAQVRVTAPDVQGIDVITVGDDPSRVTCVKSSYTLSAADIKAGFGHTIPNEKARITESWTPGVLEISIDDAPVSSQANPYGFIPFIVFPNLREPKKLWGLSDIPPLMEAQRELNRAISQLSRILEVSGNPIAVLENVEESEDIAVQPNAVWNIPEGAKAYLLDLLQGGGVRLHIDYIDLLYRTLHDISETPRAAFGGIERDLSGVALEIELHPLLQKVKRKRLIRTEVYRRRAHMILQLLVKFGGEQYAAIGRELPNMIIRPVWGPVLPADLSRKVADEQVLVQAGVHSRRRAMDDLGISDPEQEFNSWMEERGRILKQNNQFNRQSTRGGPRDRAAQGASPSFAEAADGKEPAA